MIKKKKRILQILIVILIVVFPLLNSILISIVYANTNYTISLEKGTQILEVKKYDEETWKDTVNITSTPNNWFGGDADRIGAKSKSTLLMYGVNALNTYPLFFQLIIPTSYLSNFSDISNYGYDFTYVFENYPCIYQLWDYYYSYWKFTTKVFSVNPDIMYKKLYIFKYPENISILLNDYNDFVDVLNNDTSLKLLGYSFPFLNGDDLVWQFLTKRFSIGNPKNEYLTTFINTIGCNNVTIHGNTLVFQRYGEKNYTVEVTYGIQGIIDHINVKDSEGYTFYEINSFYPKTVFYIILGILAVFILGIVVVLIIKKHNLEKNFIKSIENKS
ncbi:MAG: hypothetical protein ACFFDF_07490 [Candidatus Odinarchaeota archaeon]